jgi:site-specific recombinase XerD
MGTRTEVQAPGDLARLVDSWMLSLQSRRLSPKTMTLYSEAARLFIEYLHRQGMSTAAASIRREHVEAFLVDQMTRLAPATARSRYSALKQAFQWLLEEGEITSDPMARMKPPALDDVMVPIVAAPDLDRLMRACAGKASDDVRDAAIIWTLLSGLRLAECSGLRLGDIELPSSIKVLGKGRFERRVPLDPKAARAIDRWLRARGRLSRAARTDAVWLGLRGVLTGSGIAQMLERRCAIAGIRKVRPHELRHTSAHRAKANGLSDSVMMTVFGWRSQAMVARYGRSAAAETAAEAYAGIEPFKDL